MTIQELKEKSGDTSERLFGIIAPYPYTCPDIDRNIKDLIFSAEELANCDETEKIYWLRSLKSDIEAYLNERRETIEQVRKWGEEWKELGKELFNELNSIDERTAMKYVTQEVKKRLNHGIQD